MFNIFYLIIWDEFSFIVILLGEGEDGYGDVMHDLGARPNTGLKKQKKHSKGTTNIKNRTCLLKRGDLPVAKFFLKGETDIQLDFDGHFSLEGVGTYNWDSTKTNTPRTRVGPGRRNQTVALKNRRKARRQPQFL